MPKEGPMNNIIFHLMSWEYRIKSLFSPPEEVLAETGVKKGDKIVDYGCGPGRFTLPLADIVGEEGIVYAVDIHPLALKKVNKALQKKELNNIATIFAKDINQIPANSIDAVILFDTLHDINNKVQALKEVERMLKSKGSLYFKDHHLEKDELTSLLHNNSSLILYQKKEEIIEFRKDVNR